MSIVTIHLNLVELRKLNIEVSRAVLMNLLNSTRGLLSELVTGEVQNLKTLVTVLLIECLQFRILRCESTTCSRVHNQQHLTLVVRE